MIRKILKIWVWRFSEISTFDLAACKNNRYCIHGIPL